MARCMSKNRSTTMVFRDVDVEHTRQVRSSDVARLCCEDSNAQVLCESVRCRRTDQRPWCAEMLMWSTQDKCEAVILRDYAVKMRTFKCCVSQLDVEEPINDNGYYSNEQVLCELVRRHDVC